MQDDGCGFASASGPGEGHFGLLLMRERAARPAGRSASTASPAAGPALRWTYRPAVVGFRLMTSLAAHVEGEACPHLAVFLRSADELPGVLASFYALGVRRGGWLAHRALPGRWRPASARCSPRRGSTSPPWRRGADGGRGDGLQPSGGGLRRAVAQALDDALARGCSRPLVRALPVGPQAGRTSTRMLARRARVAPYVARPAGGHDLPVHRRRPTARRRSPRSAASPRCTPACSCPARTASSTSCVLVRGRGRSPARPRRSGARAGRRSARAAWSTASAGRRR